MSSYLYLEKRKRRGEILTEMRAIAKKGKDATEADDLKFAELKTELDIVNADIRQMAIDLEERNDHADSYVKPEERSVIGQVFRALHNPKAADISPEVRALTSSGATAIIEDERIQDEILIKLQNLNPLAELGFRYVNLENSSAWPRVTALPDVTWQATQTTQINDDASLTIESRKVSLKDLVVRVAVHNSALMDAGGRAEKLIEDAAMVALDQALLTAILHGSGASGQFQGFIKTDETIYTGVGSTDKAGAAFSYSDFLAVYRDLMNAGVPLENIGGITAPEVWYALSILQESGSGGYMDPPNGFNWNRIKASGAVSTAFASSTETCAIMGDWRQAFLGVQGPFAFKLIDAKSDYLQTVVQVHFRADLMLMQPEAFHVLYGLPLT